MNTNQLRVAAKASFIDRAGLGNRSPVGHRGRASASDPARSLRQRLRDGGWQASCGNERRPVGGVMAHEMSHVVLRHGTNQASKAHMGQTGLGVLGGLLSKEKRSTNKVISAVGGFGLNALFLKFSRTDEEQADIVGAQAMAKAGYNPQAMVDFFETLRAEQSHDPSKLEQYFSSHPAPQDRAARIRKEMAMLRIQASEAVDASNKRGIGDLGGVRRGAQISAD